jgi:glycosyltransferase involved in cell wall biosynthesis
VRILELAPPWFPIPPPGYGGIERVVFDLVEGLVVAGHEVVLFAPAGSATRARFVPSVERALGLDLTETEKRRHLFEAGRQGYRVALRLGVDLVHDHTDVAPPEAYPLPVVHTIHGPATPAAVTAYRGMSRRGDHFLAISYRQHELFAAAADGAIAFGGVVHNPVDVAGTPFYGRDRKEAYAAFVGRCHWEKDPAAAIRVAVEAGVPLKLALRVTDEERPYFEAAVRPLIDANRGLVEYLGEVGGQVKADLIGRAGAVLFPSPWEEPFGLVLAEAAAHGTPVVALRRGSVPEVVVDGVTGFACADEAAMARALPNAMALDPAACRAHAAARFDRSVVARRHADLFARVIADRRRRDARAENEDPTVSTFPLATV